MNQLSQLSQTFKTWHVDGLLHQRRIYILYMRNNIFFGWKQKNWIIILLRKIKKIKDIIQSCPVAAPRGPLAPYIFTLGRLGNLSFFFWQEKIYVGHPRFHNFRVLGSLECFYSSTSLLLLAEVAERRNWRKSYSRRSWVDEGTIIILKASW